jgi:eukaryotic-like serine/threonine-protein kinase
MIHEVAMQLETGQIIGSGNYRYQIEGLIVTDDWGELYQVQDLQRGRSFTLRLLPFDPGANPDALASFRASVDAAVDLTHPNMVPVYGIEQSSNWVYLVSQFVLGESVRKRLENKPHQPLAVDEILIFLQAITSSLENSNTQGVVHGGVRPANILKSEKGEVFLAGFGIPPLVLQELPRDEVDLTALQYQAPEQFIQEEYSLTPATDVYALGVLVYEALTRQSPFRKTWSESGAEVSPRFQMVQAILKRLPTDPSLLNPDIPVELAQVILKSLEKYPGDRYATPREFFTAVCATVGRRPENISARFAGAVSVEAGVPGPKSKFSLPKISRWVWITLAGIAACLFLSYGLLTFIRGRVPTDPATQLTFTTSTSVTAESEQPDTPASSELTPTLEAADDLSEIENPQSTAELIQIPAGEFWMGSDPGEDPYLWGAEQPQHTVYLDEYWIQKTEVSIQEYRECLLAKACSPPVRYNGYTRENYFDDFVFDTYPVVNVTWAGAAAYCDWIGGRLPSEAEWEKAARSTDGRLFAWGREHDADDQANFCDSNCSEGNKNENFDDGHTDTAPVNSFPAGASPYGVLNMSGNVWEWTADWFEADYYGRAPSRNPLGPETGTRHVIRGGSFFNPTDGIRVVARASIPSVDAKDTIGFRCVVDR